VFNKAGVDSEGKVMGSFEFTGVRPAFIEKFEQAGIKISRTMFNLSNKL
jgi:pilus assembly protein CpaF